MPDTDVDGGGQVRSSKDAQPQPERAASRTSVLSNAPAPLLPDGTIQCWGSETDTPEEVFVGVFAGGSLSCGLRPGGTVECWGGNSDQLDPPEGMFTSLSVGGGHVCGLLDGGDC